MQQIWVTDPFSDTVKIQQVKENANEHLLTPLDTSSFILLLISLLLPYDVCQSVFNVLCKICTMKYSFWEINSNKTGFGKTLLIFIYVNHTYSACPNCLLHCIKIFQYKTAEIKIWHFQTSTKCNFHFLWTTQTSHNLKSLLSNPCNSQITRTQLTWGSI